MNKMDVIRSVDKEKLESYMKIILTGLPTAMALLFGQWVLTWNYWLLGGLIISLIVFLIVSYFYLIKKYYII